MNSSSDNLISASLSTQSLTYRPNKPEVSFEVTVNNDSDRFANFQLEIIAAGEIRNPNYRWYRLEPEVAAAQPHGSSTKFQVFIFNTPIPGFVGTVNVSVKIFSPQLGRERRLLLRLEIERDNKPILISVELPIRAFQVYPGNPIDIPVRVRNQGQVASNVLLRFTGIDASWVTNSAERQLTLNVGSQTEVSFRCEPPSVVQAPSLNYPFTVEATSNNSYPANAEGNLEVLPVGFINFSTPQNKQRIPSRRPWLPDWKSKTASYELIFKNVSNLYQEINVQIQGRDWRKCTFKKFPEVANLNLAETAKVILDAKTQRPWVGIGKTLLLEAKAELSDQRLGSTDPATQSLELEVLPIIPLWLQLAVLALLAALLALLLRQEVAHTGFVNSVRISGTGTAVVSASDDCTLRFWRIRSNTLEPDETVGEASQQQFLACSKPQKGKGLLAITNDKNRVVDFVPVENNRVAVGLDNGAIQLRQVPTGEKTAELQDTEAPGDRVFDLAFTTNSLKLYSGSGKGKVRLWSRASINEEFQKQPNIDLENLQKLPNFPIRALALSPDDTILVISGNFNRFLILPLNSNQSNTPFKKLSLQKVGNIDARGGANDFIFGLAFIPNSREKILATSDSAGFIVIWDLNKCKITSNSQQQIDDLDCTRLDRWQVESKNAVRALAFSEDGSLLVSGGDDGRVITWNLSSEHKIDRTNSSTGKVIYQSSKKINSIDLRSKQGIIISGSEDFQVLPHRFK
ncbi:MAG: hypothetical protein KME29_07580 [Calothrix sp. FI2-JRJ7]|jgi:WD40 repeat protein|nr:hypothetical protein [Calothrix sp. FI2-JRJ7]